MKRKIKLLLFVLAFIPVVTLANEEYVNYYGIEISEEEYSNLLGLGFTEDEIYHMENEEFNANKDLESSLDSKVTKYFVETIRYDSTGRVVHINSNEVSEEEYNDDGIMLLDLSAFVETQYKKMTTTVAQAGTKYRYKVTLTWKLMPRVRSYDIIGIGFEDSLVNISGSLVFNQTYCISNNCTNTNTINSSTTYFDGAGVSFKLPSSTSITGLRSYFYFDVSKGIDGTITSMFVDGDYAHATSTISSYLAEVFYVNPAGIMLDDSIESYYDTIPTAEVRWSGSW